VAHCETIENTLAACLERLDLGATIQEALADEPAPADEVRELLVLAAELRRIPPPPVDAAWLSASRGRFLEAAGSLR
jgi:hypothetical protein